MIFDILPTDILVILPAYLDTFEDLIYLRSTCKKAQNLYHFVTSKVLRSLATAPETSLQPYPQLLIAAQARSLNRWARKSTENIDVLLKAVQKGPEALLNLCDRVCPPLKVDSLRELHETKRLLDAVSEALDPICGPKSSDLTCCDHLGYTMCNWWIWCDLFHEDHMFKLKGPPEELAKYPPIPYYDEDLAAAAAAGCVMLEDQEELLPMIPQKVALEWLMYCVPDKNMTMNAALKGKKPPIPSLSPETEREYLQLEMSHLCRELAEHLCTILKLTMWPREGDRKVHWAGNLPRYLLHTGMDMLKFVNLHSKKELGFVEGKMVDAEKVPRRFRELITWYENAARLEPWKHRVKSFSRNLRRDICDLWYGGDEDEDEDEDEDTPSELEEEEEEGGLGDDDDAPHYEHDQSQDGPIITFQLY